MRNTYHPGGGGGDDGGGGVAATVGRAIVIGISIGRKRLLLLLEERGGNVKTRLLEGFGELLHHVRRAAAATREGTDVLSVSLSRCSPFVLSPIYYQLLLSLMTLLMTLMMTFL